MAVDNDDPLLGVANTITVLPPKRSDETTKQGEIDSSHAATILQE